MPRRQAPPHHHPPWPSVQTFTWDQCLMSPAVPLEAQVQAAGQGLALGITRTTL